MEYSGADYFNDPYNSRDLNPTEPMDQQKGVVELSGCMGISVGMGMFM